MSIQPKETGVWHAVLVLLGAPAVYVLVFACSGLSFRAFSNYAFVAGMAVEWVFLLIVLWSLRRAGKGVKDIGLTAVRLPREVLLGVGMGLVFGMASGGLITVLEMFLPSGISREPRPLWAALVFGFALVTAFAPIEETVWRGYAITSLRPRLGTMGAVAAASAAFGLVHWWGGVALVVGSTILSFAYSGLYLWRKSLVANIVCHLVADLPLFLFMLLL